MTGNAFFVHTYTQSTVSVCVAQCVDSLERHLFLAIQNRKKTILKFQNFIGSSLKKSLKFSIGFQFFSRFFGYPAHPFFEKPEVYRSI